MTSKGVALITGSVRGIGAAIALRLARDGYDIALADLPGQTSLLSEVSKQIVETGRNTHFRIKTFLTVARWALHTSPLATPYPLLALSLLMGKNKAKRLGRKINHITGVSWREGRTIHTQITSIREIEARRKRAQENVDRSMAGLSSANRQAIADITEASEQVSQDDFPDNNEVMDAVLDEDQQMDIPFSDQPDSDEFAQALRDMVSNPRNFMHKRDDTRNRRQRLKNLDENWQPLIPGMVSAYLAWKAANSTMSPSTSPATPADASPFEYDIDVLNVYTLQRSARIVPTDADISGAAVLIKHGYIGNSPLRPSIAISLTTLELFRRLRLRSPSFSCEAFCKVVCDLNEISYRRSYRTTFADVFDIYMIIRRSVDAAVQQALGQDSPDWRLKDEPPLIFERLFCIDGNDSLKRMLLSGGRAFADSRNAPSDTPSDYYLSREFVDSFANEVKSRRANDADGTTTSPMVPATNSCESEGLQEGDPTDGTSGDPALQGCVKNWKAAASDSKKKMWGVFDETGLFASVCCHGLFMWVADMVRSGEQAKYPLAIMSKVLSTLGPRMGCAYDIGCSFETTIKSSSLGPEFLRQQARCFVNAFHGYSHSYGCQIKYHPINIQGLGLRDLEDCERAFSVSNRLASHVRHATPYRRHVAITMHCEQNDEDKYGSAGLMLYNNYVQALCIIEDEGLAVEQAMAEMLVTEDDLVRFIEEEREYVTSLGKESSYDIHAVTYVETLQEYRKIQASSQNAHSRFLNTIPEDYSARPASGSSSQVSRDISETRKREVDRRVQSARLLNFEQQLAEMEVAMGISRRWDPSDPDYVAALTYSCEREYHQAVDELQRLVVQRLFELQKLNLCGTGYRVRTHLAKAIQSRSKTIQHAVEVYNAAASTLSPPRPSVDWSVVSAHSFLEQFTLLRETSGDVLARQWAQPVVRELLRQYRRVKRAREEIARCNIEVRRLHTWIIAEGQHMEKIVQTLRATSDPLLTVVEEHCQRRRRLNAGIMQRLQQLFALPGYSGDRTPGECLNVWGEKGAWVGGAGVEGGADIDQDIDMSSSSVGAEDSREGSRGPGDDHDAAADDDLVESQAASLVDYIGQLTIA
ncbi:hypothetical protein EIP91_009022 [Steccherinum ochraceum]|uniref:CxC1-like cysteine cluster associated with KDZ transposases domain-containing protein n=1 Tax=Steccherinum ochraceum TaxID=92696 RepID=A0A4R0R7Q5_9APHY|nr:hypothetical protein EIP91_009022 [Steccherinum ochraceum]